MNRKPLLPTSLSVLFADQTPRILNILQLHLGELI